MPGISLNSENQSEDLTSFSSMSFEKVDNEAIKQIQALKSLLDKAKTPLYKDALQQLIPVLSGKGTTDFFYLNEAYKNLIQSLNEEPELDRSLVCEALGLDAELDNASDLADLIKGQIAEFSEKKLLEMLYFSQISYGDVDRKLAKDGYKTKKQFEEEGYQIIKFYDNELIQGKYCPDSDYKLEQHNVGYALTGSNSYTRDAGYVFIKDKEVTIAYHGTRDRNDAVSDLDALLTEVQFSDKKVGSVHHGFYSLFKRSWPNVHKILQGHANDKGLKGIKNLKINITGHSMGGALATIAALCLNKTEDAEDVHVATLGSPRVLYQDAAEVYDERLGDKTIRVACQSDPVPCLPFGGGGQYYKHVGKPLKLETGSHFNPFDHKLSNYLNFIKSIKQEIFKSDNNVSRYFLPAYVFGTVCSNIPKDTPSSNDEEFFEKVKEENRGIKLSEIPGYAPKLEEELKQAEQERDELNREKSQLEKKLNSVKQELEKAESKNKELDDANQKVARLEQEKSKQQASIEELKNTQTQLEQERESVKQELGRTTEELKKKEADLENNKKELNVANGKVSQLQEDLKQAKQKIDDLTAQVTQLEKLQKELDTKTKEFQDTKAQLEQERNSTKQNLTNKTSEVTQLTKESTQLKDSLKATTEDNAQLQSELESIRKTLGERDSTVTQLTEENTKLKNELELKKPESENDDLKTKPQESESKSKELNGKNEKLSAASAQSRKQVTYASVSFVLSGALAVGASLTMFHLAICIALAVTASTLLATGCYCSYKANTALSNVEIDQVSRDEEMAAGC